MRAPAPSRSDLAVPGVVALWVVVVLGLDTVATLGQQRALGAVTWALLLGLLAREDRTTRAQVAVVVVFATVVEYVFAGWLGVYVYRLDNVPAFVPPGHGLVYLAALSLGRSAWASRHARAFLVTTMAACAAWAAWGLLLSPRPDVLGAFWCACLLAFARWGSSPLLYASAFVVVSGLELVGTSLGTWTWQPYDPTGVISIGNPPSGIAGGYAWFDAAALAATPWLLRHAGTASSRTGGRRRASATTATSTSPPPSTCSGPRRSPSSAAAAARLTTGSTVDTTAVSAGPSRSSAAKNADTAITVLISATPASASQPDGRCGSAGPAASATVS